jgi:1-acyl-sn-glycerol-3-phosphate acyltransferase
VTQITSQPITSQGRQIESISIAEIFNHFKIRPAHWYYYVLRVILSLPAKRFGDVAARFDHLVGEAGLYQAMCSIRRRFITSLEAVGAEQIPAEGPLLITSNHPGAADSVALLATIKRPDLRVIVSDRPLLRALTYTSQHFIFLNTQVSNRMEALRSVVRSLRNGEAVLIYPGGSIEPDPTIVPGAVESLQQWSHSIGLFLNKVPGVKLMPVVVSGVFSPQAWRHPLSRLGRTVREQQQIAMIFQGVVQQILPNLWPVNTRVYFAPPIQPAQMDPELDPDQLQQAALAYTSDLMTSVVNA